MTAEQKTRSVFQCCSSKFDVPKWLLEKTSRSALERCSSNSDVPKWLIEEKVTKRFGVLLLKLRCLDMPVKTNVTKCVGWLFWQRSFPKWLSKEKTPLSLLEWFFVNMSMPEMTVKKASLSASEYQHLSNQQKKEKESWTNRVFRTIQHNSPDTKRGNKTRHQLCRQENKTQKTPLQTTFPLPRRVETHSD